MRRVIMMAAALVAAVTGNAEAQWVVDGGTARGCGAGSLGVLTCIEVHTGAGREPAEWPYVVVWSEIDSLWTSVTVQVGTAGWSKGSSADFAWNRVQTNHGRKDADEIIAALKAGNIAVVIARPGSVYRYEVGLRGSAAAIEKALSASWSVRDGWTYTP